MDVKAFVIRFFIKRMGIFDYRFIKKSKDGDVVRSNSQTDTSAIPCNEAPAETTRYSFDNYDLIFSPSICTSNFITLFCSVPEVYFPVKFIIDKINTGIFQLKRSDDDSVVWDNESINRFLSRPNALFSFKEFVSQHFAFKLLTGNSFIKAAVPGMLHISGELWELCDNYWVLPANNVSIKTPVSVPLFSTAKIEDIIKCYELCINGQTDRIDPCVVLHSRELNISENKGNDYFRGNSRLLAQKKPISNLIAVYEARNVIYVKRGAIGMFVSNKKDDAGTAPLTPKESDSIRNEYENTYGVTEGKSPIGVVNHPVGFIKLSASIQELQPFEETLEDACQIAGAFGIPSELIPRKDHGTFSNLGESEKKVYTSVIIPEAQEFAKDLTRFLGLDKSGMYLDVDFSHVDCLQSGQKEKEENKKIVSDRCRGEFLSGIITMNDWRAKIGESKVDNPIYDKLLFNMSDEEQSKVKSIVSINQTAKKDGEVK